MDASQTELDRRLAVPMFVASLAYLTCLSGVLHMHDSVAIPAAFTICAWGLAVIYPLFVLELGLHWQAGGRLSKRDVLYCLLPPMRLGARDHSGGNTMWLPVLGWKTVDKELRARVEKGATVPMIVVALLVLPLLAVDFIWSSEEAPEAIPQLVSQVGASLIWLAFTFEFIVMISIVKGKVRYCKEHWIDIAVIFLPLIAFLRVARLGRLGRLVKVQQITKTARIYRMRGLLLRLWRALLLVDAIDRLLRGKPERQLTKLQATLAAKQREVEELRGEIARLEELVAQTHEAPSAAIGDAA